MMYGQTKIKFVISVCASLCLSARMEKLGSYWTDFYKIWYLSTFPKSVEKFQVSLKTDKNNEYFTWRPIHIFYHISPNFS